MVPGRARVRADAGRTGEGTGSLPSRCRSSRGLRGRASCRPGGARRSTAGPLRSLAGGLLRRIRARTGTPTSAPGGWRRTPSPPPRQRGERCPTSRFGTTRCSGTPWRRPPGPTRSARPPSRRLVTTGLRAWTSPASSRQPARPSLGTSRASARSAASAPSRRDRPLHASVPGASGGLTTYDNHTPAALFGFGPIQDYRDSTQVVANLDQGGMGLPSRDFYLSDDAKMKERRQKSSSTSSRSSASPAPPSSARTRTGRRCSASRPRSPVRRWTS